MTGAVKNLLFLKKKQKKNFLSAVAWLFDRGGLNNHATADKKFFGFPGGTPFFQNRTF
jgi:hypothetical protein